MTESKCLKSQVSLIEDTILILSSIITYDGNNTITSPNNIDCLSIFQSIFTGSKNTNINIKFTRHIIKLGEVITYINFYNNHFSRTERINDSKKIKDYKIKYNYHFNFICQRLHNNINDIIDVVNNVGNINNRELYIAMWNMPKYDKNGNYKEHSRVNSIDIKKITKNNSNKIYTNYDGLSVQSMPISILFKKKSNSPITPYFGFDETNELLPCLFAYIDNNSILHSILDTEKYNDKKSGCLYSQTNIKYYFYLEICLPFEGVNVSIKSYDSRIIHALCKVPYNTNELFESLKIDNYWEDSLIRQYKKYQKKVESVIMIHINKKFNSPEFNFIEIICDNSQCKCSQIIEKWDGKSDKKYECIKCYNSIMCRSCCNSYHEGSCNFSVDSKSILWIKENTQPCPCCKTNIEKNGGCNHMTCRKCSPHVNFCWECKTVYSLHEINDHYNDYNSYLGCRQRESNVDNI